MEMTDSQSDTDIKNAFHVRFLEFYKPCLPADKFTVFSDHAQGMTSLFGSTSF
jgi:hypothetical protein